MTTNQDAAAGGACGADDRAAVDIIAEVLDARVPDLRPAVLVNRELAEKAVAALRAHGFTGPGSH